MTFQEMDVSARPRKTIAVHSTLHDLTFTDALPGDSPALTLGAVQLGATLTTAMVKHVSLGDIAATCP